MGAGCSWGVMKMLYNQRLVMAARLSTLRTAGGLTSQTGPVTADGSWEQELRGKAQEGAGCFPGDTGQALEGRGGPWGAPSPQLCSGHMPLGEKPFPLVALGLGRSSSQPHPQPPTHCGERGAPMARIITQT